MTQTPSQPEADASPPMQVRSFESRDQERVSFLYDHGLLAGQIAPNDTGADIDNIHAAYFDDERHHFWVAETDGRVVGMIGVASDERDTAEVRRLRVEAELQHTPIASALVEAALAHCKHHGYLKVRLDTRFDSDTAVGMFDKIGFQHTRTRTTPGKEMLEFYLDLYREHEPEEGEH
ncbi:MAG: GNAT family N-acetyltransferase [Planctomycetota bacterium]